MGAKPPAKLKLRHTYKCDDCDKKFLSKLSLKSHHLSTHKLNQKESKRKLVNLIGKSVKRTPGKARKDVEDVPQVSDVRKIEYECPQCVNRFTVYFSAYRHIQKFHCVNGKGKKVPPNSPDLIKPIRIETCIKCNMRVRTAELHSCPNTDSSTLIAPLGSECTCLGCEQKFPSMLLFDLHVQGLHSQSAETLYFPSMHTFTQWKEDMESQTQVKYLILGKCNYKQIYRCTYSPDGDHVEQDRFCPSSIIVREYSKSIQVHFLKEHHGHSCEYKLPDTFKKFQSSEGMKTSYGLYAKLKFVMDSILESANTADTETVDLVYNKMLNIEKILKVDEAKAVNKNMTDDQITETLESLSRTNVKTKRKPLEKTGDSQVKKMRRRRSSANVVEQEKTDVEKPVIKDKVMPKKDVPVETEVSDSDNQELTCFNDSYKNFVNKITDKTPAFKNNRGNTRKKVLKTKIGQFKPLSPKKDRDVQKVEVNEDFNDNGSEKSFSSHSIELSKPAVDIDYEIIEQEDDCNILVLKL